MDNQLFKQHSTITIRQNNAITEAKYDMSALQKNMFYLLLSQLKDEHCSQNKYKLSIKDINSSRNIRVRRAELLQAAKGLITTGLTLYDNSQARFITIGILTSADYGENTDKENLILEFDQKLYPFLYNVKSRFTTFTLLNALNLKSKYSKRIYEMLCQFKDTGIFRISVQELKERLGLVDLKTGKETYSDFGEFARKVLEVAKKEVNERTDLSFIYTTKKTGKKITDLEFHITYNSNTQKSAKPALNLSISNEIPQKESEQLQKATSKKEKEFEKLPLEQYRLYKRLKELALSKELATLVVKNIPIRELESEINNFCNSVTQRKNKTTVTPHFQDLLYRYAGIRVRRNYKADSISKKEPTDVPLEERKSDSVEEIDPVYTFCFNTLKSFGINYAGIQSLIIQAPLNEIKIFLENISEEFKKNEEPNKVDYVIKKFYTAFGSPHTKISEQKKVQTLGEKLRNVILQNNKI